MDANGKGWRELKGGSTDDIALKAKAEGYDGVIYKNVKDYGTMTSVDDVKEYEVGHTHYVVFDPKNIKIIKRETISTKKGD